MNPQSSVPKPQLDCAKCVSVYACREVNWPKHRPSGIAEDLRLESLILIMVSSGGL